jgi:hypothetical protein
MARYLISLLGLLLAGPLLSSCSHSGVYPIPSKLQPVFNKTVEEASRNSFLNVYKVTQDCGKIQELQPKVLEISKSFVNQVNSNSEGPSKYLDVYQLVEHVIYGMNIAFTELLQQCPSPKVEDLSPKLPSGDIIKRCYPDEKC